MAVVMLIRVVGDLGRWRNRGPRSFARRHTGLLAVSTPASQWPWVDGVDHVGWRVVGGI
jgi:hypothetical protein